MFMPLTDILCDAASNSEIVLPLVVKNQIIGVLDIDSTVFSRFTTEDAGAARAGRESGKSISSNRLSKILCERRRIING
jgi:hypothetical protein